LSRPAVPPAGATDSLTPATGERLQPNLRSGLSPAVQGKLLEAFGLAARRVARSRTCGGLFAPFDGSGIDSLQRTFYYPAPPEVVRARCVKGAAAATVPGSTVTWLCPSFGSLTTQRAALVLVHEALHCAGLPERPQVPGAMSSAEINDLVRDGCGF